MNLREDDAVRVAVVRAAARPGPYLVGLVAGWIVSGPAGMIAGLLAASTAFLATVLGVLVVSPEVRSPELPEGDAPAPLALPEGQERRRTEPRPSRPLPPELRGRFQDVHRSVQAMLRNWPQDMPVPLEKGHLERSPEAFREMAHLWLSMDPRDPGRGRLAARMESLEQQVDRLRATWSELVSRQGDQGEILERLERTGDALEAILEVS